MLDKIQNDETVWNKKDMGSKSKAPADPTDKSGSWKTFFVLIMVLILLLCSMAGIAKKIGGGTMMAFISNGEYGVYTTADGETKIIEKHGWHWVWFNKVSFYQKRMEVEDDEYIKATFSDAKQRGIKTTVTLALPVDREDRIDLHIRMAGDADNLSDLTRLTTKICIRSTAPIMTGEEVMETRKYEFCNNVWEQMKHGLYIYHSTTKEIDGKQVFVTEIVRDEKGKPITAADPVFENYHIQLVSISWDEIRRTEQERIDIKKAKVARRLMEESKMEKEYLEAEKEKVEKEIALVKMRAALKEQLAVEQAIDDKKLEAVKEQEIERENRIKEKKFQILLSELKEQVDPNALPEK